jgi:hypothetical protein
MNLNIQKALGVMLFEKQREQYTLTDIYDLKKALNFKMPNEDQ